MCSTVKKSLSAAKFIDHLLESELYVFLRIDEILALLEHCGSAVQSLRICRINGKRVQSGLENLWGSIRVRQQSEVNLIANLASDTIASQREL